MEEHLCNDQQTGEVQESFSLPEFKEMARPNDDTLTSVDIQEMERVRLSLQSMLKSSEQKLLDDKISPQRLLRQGLPERGFSSGVDDESFISIGTADLLDNFVNNNKPGAAVVADQIAEPMSQPIGRSRQKYDNSLLIENSLLNENLEKECLKRKHCEEQIKELQSKLLETMQELAVLVSGDRKKDAMINQLDKKMAKVVEDWKKHEHEKIDALNKLEERRIQDEQSQLSHREMLAQFEKDLTQAVEALSKEQERATNTEKAKDAQINEITQDRDQLLALLEKESQNNTALRKKLEELEDRNERDEVNTAVLEQEKQTWHRERSELEGKIELITAAQSEDLENERKLLENEKQVAEDSQKVLSAVQKEVQLLNVQLDTANREKENLKTEITLLTARFEAQKTRLDGERQAELEKQLERRLHETQNQSRKNEEEIRKAYKKQIEDLTKRYKNDLDSQLRDFHEQLKERDLKERNVMQTYDDYEKKLSKCRAQIATLTAERESLRNGINKLVHRLRKMMRSHCEEALSLLAASIVDDNGTLDAPHNRSDDSLWLGRQTPAPVTTASFVGVVRDPTQDSYSFHEQNISVPYQKLSSSKSKSISAKKDDGESEQRWVRLTPMAGIPLQDHRSVGPSNTQSINDHSFRKNKMEGVTAGALRTDYNDGKKQFSEQSPSETNESFEEQPLDDQQPEIAWSSTNLGTDVLKMLEHQHSRQSELNHYVRQLLKKSPSSTSSVDLPDNPNTTQTGLFVENGEYENEKDNKANDSKNVPTVNQSASSSIEYTDKHLAFRKSFATPTRGLQSSKIPVHNTPPNKDHDPDKRGNGDPVLSPKQVGQLARLIDIYQKDKNVETLSPQKMFQYLREVQTRSIRNDEVKQEVGLSQLQHATSTDDYSERPRKQSKVKRKLEVNIPPNKPKELFLSNVSKSTDDNLTSVTRKSLNQEELRKPPRVPLTSDSDISLPRKLDHKSSRLKHIKPQKRYSSGKAWK